MKHTPGEWEAFVDLDDYGGWRLPVKNVRIWSGDTLICSYTTEYADYPDDDTNAANARLIAAAPDLLEALKAAQAEVAYLRRHAGDVPAGHWLAVTGLSDQINAAILKAIGEEKK